MDFNKIAESIANFFSQLFLDETPPKLRSDVPFNSLNQIIYNIICHYNSGETFIYYPVRNDPKGTLNAYIGHNDDNTNKLVADTIVASASATGLDVYYLASVIMQESQFSPACYNHNLSASNLVPTFKRTDIGIGQFSGSFLASKPGMSGLSESDMEKKAHDPTWAIPTMANIYSGLISEAERDLNEDDALSKAVTKLNTTSFSNPQWLAAAYYNRGATGAKNYIKSNAVDLLKHPFRCNTWYNLFKNYAKSKSFIVSKSLQDWSFENHNIR